jgi:acyl-CoA thioester hydrolase
MPDVRHRFACPLRWADLDLLGHVNNVRYADYLREARDDLLHAAGVDAGPGGLTVDRHELTFLAPMHFGPEPVVVECWLSALDATSAVIEHVVHDGADEPLTYLRARSFVSGTGLEPLAAYLEPGEGAPTRGTPAAAKADPKRSYPLRVRASDLDLTGHASDVSCVEYFQEARIDFLRILLHELPDTGGLRWVVAQTDIDYLAPIAPSRTPYAVSSRLARVGNKSMLVESVLRDAAGQEHAGARVVLVVFDPATQRAAEPPAGYREVLEALVEVG